MEVKKNKKLLKNNEMSNNYITEEQYKKLYQYSITQPENFWAEQALKFIKWISPWEKVFQDKISPLDCKWFAGGKLNACYNCIDQYLTEKKEQIAIFWQGDEPNRAKQITYLQLHREVCLFANVLKKHGVQKGDRVVIYLPMIIEAVVAMLSCARIGAVHVVIFSGFAATALASRISDTNSRLVITADASRRGGKINMLKKNIDEALILCPKVEHVIVIQHEKVKVAWLAGRDYWYHEERQMVTAECQPMTMDANDPLFILYTSGSTGTPKGVVHNTAGYLLYVTMSFKYVFNYHDNDIYWCTADIGWITGHSYLVYGPLTNGATILLFEGTPDYPDFARYWDLIDKYKVNIFYTSPTALRTLRKEGDQWLKSSNRASLKILGSVGENINPEVWQWYYTIVGKERCPIIDTWWQTETGGILITSFPHATKLKPGAAALPFFGIVPEVLDDNGIVVANNIVGKLIIRQNWPALMGGIYNNSLKFKEYFSYPAGEYITGDQALRDEDGYFWLKGRVDDVIKVSGHRLSSAELENVLIAHPAVGEAAVVAVSDNIKGEAIYVFVVLKNNISPDLSLKNELISRVRLEIGAIATPKEIKWAEELPKTRSGKIMRRVLAKIANGEKKNFGDLSTCINPQILAILCQT